jgi:hypothetical protein
VWCTGRELRPRTLGTNEASNKMKNTEMEEFSPWTAELEKKLLELYQFFVYRGKGVTPVSWKIIVDAVNEESNVPFTVSDCRRKLLTMINDISIPDSELEVHIRVALKGNGQKANEVVYDTPEEFSQLIALWREREEVHKRKFLGKKLNQYETGQEHSGIRDRNKASVRDEVVNDSDDSNDNNEMSDITPTRKTSRADTSVSNRTRKWTREMEYNLLLYRFEVLHNGADVITRRDWDNIAMKMSVLYQRQFTSISCRGRISDIRKDFPHFSWKSKSGNTLDAEKEEQLLLEFIERYMDH